MKNRFLNNFKCELISNKLIFKLAKYKQKPIHLNLARLRPTYNTHLESILWISLEYLFMKKEDINTLSFNILVLREGETNLHKTCDYCDITFISLFVDQTCGTSWILIQWDLARSNSTWPSPMLVTLLYPSLTIWLLLLFSDKTY